MIEEDIQRFKLIFLGDQYVGKSSILNRFRQDKFEQDYQATIGLDFHSKDVNINSVPVKFILYDTSGQKTFKSLIPMYTRDSNIFLVLYDITNKDSFIHAEYWVNETKNLKKEDAIFVLVGNKIDLEEKRIVSTKEAEDLANEKGFLFYEVSAKTGEKVEDLFNNKIFPEIARKYGIEEKEKKNEEVEEEEEDDEEEKDLLINENDKLILEPLKSKNCSLLEHKDIEAIKYCQNCNIFMCNKWEKHHSELFHNHHEYNLDKNTSNIFTGLCKKNNHLKKLEYFCKNHNLLCCAACIAKIKGKGNGEHKDCDVCFIKKIKKDKKETLNTNLKFLEELSQTLNNSIFELKKLYEKICENKENLKMKIQQIFTKIRNTLNEREDQLILEVDKQFDNLYFKKELIKHSEKLPNIINILKERGKKKDDDWNDNEKLSSIINDCIIIENNIKDIKEINEKIEKSKSSLNIKIEFSPKEEDINEFLDNIKKFGKIFCDNELLNDKKDELIQNK